MKDKMGLPQSFEYDPHGNVLVSKATNGLITRFSYDILDNLLQVTMPSNLTTHYTYDVMSNVTSMTDTMKRVTKYTYDLEGNMTSLTDISGRTEQMSYDAGGRLLNHTSNGGNKINYDYDTLNSLVEKSYEDTRDSEDKEGVLYGYDALGQRKSMMDRSGESTYEYDGLGRITKVTTGSSEVTSYKYDGSDQLESITYPDGKKVSYKYDKNDNLTEVTDRTGAKTTYVYDAINRITEIHRPNGVSTYNTYNARDQIVSMKNICEDCDWVVSQYDYTYDDRGFIVAEDAVESLYGYAWDDKHDGKHENWHDTLYPHGDKHYNKHDKDGLYGFQIIETKRAFEYDDDDLGDNTISADKNAGYAGDIYGFAEVGLFGYNLLSYTPPSLGQDDYRADLDAVNLSSEIGNRGDILNDFIAYYMDIEEGYINRAEEFAVNFGNGDGDKGILMLEEEVNKFITKQKVNSVPRETDTATAFLQHIKDKQNEW